MQPLGVDEPTAIGPYRLLGRLGSGGMGRVYLGRSAGGRTVAVKVVHPHLALDEEFRARFRREVEAARRVGAAWTAPVLDADPEAPVPWVATAYAAGPSLAAAVADGGPLPAHSVRALGAGLAEALAAVHELGLVHRDVKPSNVLLTLDGPLLIDFGIARALDGTASLTSTGVSVGSPGYMAPEQILGKGVTGAADVFSLGAVLAYAATGEPPFPGDSSAALLYKVVHEEPHLDALEGELREVVEACLAKEPGARPVPAEAARRLAPEGAARLVAGGWLPGALVEQVSRGAVRLLNLEAAGAGAASSGPVAFSSPAVGEGSPAGAFGPPPVMPEPRRAEPEDKVSDGGKRPGKVSVSVAATAAPEADGRGRRVSCTVALAVAGAFAAATVGSVLVLDLLPGERQDSAGESGPRDAYSPAPGASLSSGPSDIPARYLGTWEGQGTALDGTLPAGTFRVTVQQAEVGEELGRLRQTDQLGGVCVDVLTLQRVTEKQLVARSVGQKGNHGGCNQEPTTVRLVPTGDDLTYESDSARSGYPTARMSKVK
ncbi:serine/threonine-protein kinase [Streptomyces sp. TRM70350]|uniref:serine/threonine-protein kinase n=1 Tax=Streptomyces sp. TRM70350 TaxID=2856165 RepID=UPI001C4592FF|nr:serine/threonine-protein kinase [Streptomyces sp. TRM70350]MBV7696917.1 serine/threonine protein kinase [Streptomyces sp. TRM70350]